VPGMVVDGWVNCAWRVPRKFHTQVVLAFLGVKNRGQSYWLISLLHCFITYEYNKFFSNKMVIIITSRLMSIIPIILISNEAMKQ
jgi:hypothetical protein